MQGLTPCDPFSLASPNATYITRKKNNLTKKIQEKVFFFKKTNIETTTY